jgi:large subunit ribosomal protein L22
MNARAIARYVRISPRKVRQVISLIKGKKVQEASDILNFLPKKSARLLEKVLHSAISNAESKIVNVDKDELFVLNAYVDCGPTLKRIMPRARGRADLIRKRTSHITVIVGIKEE